MICEIEFIPTAKEEKHILYIAESDRSKEVHPPETQILTPAVARLLGGGKASLNILPCPILSVTPFSSQISFFRCFVYLSFVQIKLGGALH